MLYQRTVFVIDEHAEVRQALVAWLAAVPGIWVVGDTGDPEQAMLTAANERPDVIIIEPKRLDGLGMALVQRLAQLPRRPHLILLTSYPSDWERWHALRMGAAAYLLKDLGSNALGQELLRSPAAYARPGNGAARPA